jgi:hypothetical protein
VLAADGFFCFIRLGMKLRNWQQQRAQIGYAIILLAMCIFVTASAFYRRMFDFDTGMNMWNENWKKNQELEKVISQFDPADEKIVMTNDPPGFSLVTTRPAVMIPDGDINTLKLAAIHYNAEFLVVDKHLVNSGIRDLIDHPMDHAGLSYLGLIGKSHLYRFD